MLDKLKVAAVLFLIGAFSGGLIYGVHLGTKDRIEQNEIDKQIAYYREIFEVPNDQEIIYNACTTDESEAAIEGFEIMDECPEGINETIIRYKETNELIGYAYLGKETNSYGDVNVLLGITEDGIVKQVVISSSTNTPNFVKKIEKEQLYKFSSVDVNEVEYDSYTGASYTYGSVSDVVQNATRFFDTVRGIQ